MTTRAEQKEQRRQQILFKALELFARKGYSDTKIGDIAEAVGMSTGLMFHYFDSKEQLYEELVRMGAAYTNMPGELPYRNPAEYFEGFLNALFGYVGEQPWVFYMFVLMAQARRSEAVPLHVREIAMGVSQIEQSAKIIEEGQRQGYFREGDAHLLAFTFWSSVQGIMEQLAVTPGMSAEGEKLPRAEWLLDILLKRKQ
ncbi:MAG: TetR/AcrR family transcriptional regulator [Acetatifactor sp.]|nr:TetR/AcrR family transcriptional regulator [Acetatifactor sp.]MDE7113279.1 TetR/AcrR family transcriptional regulator [Acetatifactor sp.]